MSILFLSFKQERGILYQGNSFSTQESNPVFRLQISPAGRNDKKNVCGLNTLLEMTILSYH